MTGISHIKLPSLCLERYNHYPTQVNQTPSSLTPLLSHLKANYSCDHRLQRRPQYPTQRQLPEDTQPIGNLTLASCYDRFGSWRLAQLAESSATRHRVIVTWWHGKESRGDELFPEDHTSGYRRFR